MKMTNQSRYSKTFNQLCHMVALSRDGKTEVALDNLILTIFGIDESFAPTNINEITEAIDVYFNLTLEERVLESSINRLISTNKIYSHRGVFVVTPQVLASVKARIQETNVTEEAVRKEWFTSFEKFPYPIPTDWLDPLWMCLKNYMARAFHRHGIETTLLLDPKYDIPREDRKHLSTYLEEAISEACGQIPAEKATEIVSSFFTTNTDLRTKYVAQLLDATFTYFALTIDRTASDYLSSNIPSLSLFLDTNFIFGLLDLSSSPLAEVTKELVRIIQTHNLPFRLYYHEKTLEEFLSAIHVVGSRLKGRNWTQSLSKAAIHAPLSGIEYRYHKENSVNPIHPDIFLSKYEHAIELLSSMGFTIYRSSGSNKKLDNERYELTTQYDEYIKQNRKRGEKAYEVLNHDIVLWQTVNELRVNGSSVLDAHAFVLTIDYYLYSFDWQLLRQKSHVGRILLPNHFLQILRPFLPVNDDLNKHFVETFAIPAFRATEADYSTVNSKILSYLTTFRGVEEETAIRMLSNTLLQDRLKDIEESSKEFKDIVDGALIEEIAQLTEKVENLTEEAEATRQLAQKQTDIATQRERSLNELREERQNLTSLIEQNKSEIVELSKKLESEREKASSKEVELEKSQRERDRYEMYARIVLGIIVSLVGFVLVFFFFPRIHWFNTHPHKNGLYLAAILEIIGLSWLVADNNPTRKGYVFGGMVVTVIIELIQVL
ncbi:MAG: hypothetical protein H6658_13480 [Ardenticatenaceae bacterium]|nr:hypothetical protein [Ardenticatenaceae bacterium]